MMSTIKSLLVKAEKPQDQTCASQAQALIEATLADRTTGLSDAIDSAVYSSVINGTGMVKMGLENGAITATGGPYTFTTGTTTTPYHGPATIQHIHNNNIGTHKIINSAYPRVVALKHAELDSHPVFQMTTEQLRAAWMITYGSRWIALGEINDDDTALIMERLKSLGEMEIHNVVDQYSPMGRLKL